MIRLEEEKVQTDSLSRKPFVTTSRIRSKTEDIFFDPEYRFPGMGPGTGLKRLESMVSVLFQIFSVLASFCDVYFAMVFVDMSI